MIQKKNPAVLAIMSCGILVIIVGGSITYWNATHGAIAEEILFEDVKTEDLTATQEIPASQMKLKKERKTFL